MSVRTMADITAVPEPVRGGTWIYCRHTWREAGFPHSHNTCLGRFRTAKKYRQHWRRFHQEAC